jgi:hypothetical protein
MDPMLEHFIGGERDRPTMKLWFLVNGGAVIFGGPAHPSRWAEDVNAVLDRTADKSGETFGLHYLRMNPADHEADEPGYVTLREVEVVLPSGQRFEVAALRLALEQVAAWWVGAPSPPAEEPDVAE